MDYEIVHGDLLRQPVEAIVNPWNRNTIPWWLLLPHGVSGAIKKEAGTQPFKEIGRHGRLALGSAVSSSAGRLPFKRIIHVAGINDVWRATDKSVRDSVRNAVALASKEGIKSLALPLIGSGAGSFSPELSLKAIQEELSMLDYHVKVRIVVFKN